MLTDCDTLGSNIRLLQLNPIKQAMTFSATDELDSELKPVVPAGPEVWR